MVQPVEGGIANGTNHVVDGLKPTAIKCQGTQRFPPRLNQVKPGGVSRLKQKTNAGMSQCPELNIKGAMDGQIVKNENEIVFGPMSYYLVQEKQKIIGTAR